jgi:hypothetical protein
LAGSLFAMLLNVIFHVAATVGLREYAPGVITAALINVPRYGVLLRRMFQDKWVCWRKAVVAFILVPLVLLLLIPVLLWVGRSI